MEGEERKEEGNGEEHVLERNGKEILRGRLPFKVDSETRIRKGLLENYGPGRYVLRSGGTLVFEGRIEAPRKTWTRKERREHLRWRYYGLKEKAFVLAGLLVIIIMLLWIMSMALHSPDPFLLGFLVLIAGGFLAAAAFCIDMIFFETE